jgi:hypothetical protein
MALSGAATTQAIIGRQFGKLIPIMVGVETGFKGSRVLCICDCGNEMVVKRRALFAENRPVRSCVACSKKITGIKNKTHGMAGTRIYRILAGMKHRCNDMWDKDYPNYGGRGIRICDEWQDVNNFAQWAFANGYADKLTIDRIDVNGNYEPSNCRFITLKENSSLTRNTHWVEAFGETKTIAEWAKDERCKVTPVTVYNRWRYQGWSPENAITIPASYSNKSRRLHG